MEISIEFKGRKYKYTQFGRITTWIDDKNLVVPVFLHPKLRECAISSGYDISLFLNGREELAPEEDSDVDNRAAVKVASKNKLKGTFNPFK